MKEYNVAIVGATGAVGEEMRKVLDQRDFPISSLRLLASSRSAGKTRDFKGEELIVHELGKDSFEGIDIALFSAGGSISKEYAPLAAESGTVVIDNSSAFRQVEDVPLVVPEVNPDDTFKHSGIIANPNCSTIQMVVVLKPLHDYSRIKRIVVSTYQSVSGTGRDAMEELDSQTRAYVAGDEIKNKVYPHQIAFNCLPHIDVFLKNAYTKEEMKMVWETQKIMGDKNIKVTATTVRVPVFVSHSESVNVETEKKINGEKAKQLLRNSPGVKVIDDPKNSSYPLPVSAAGRDECFVGRIREDETIDCGLNLWIVSDNLRKGAALNAVQIGELLIRENA